MDNDNDRLDGLPEHVTRDSQLPANVQDLPRHARRIWKAAFNNMHSQTAAWNAVHSKYEPGSDGTWHQRAEPLPIDDGAIVADAHGTLNHFIRLAKVDAAKREVWGWAAEESPDNQGEIMDYALSKPYWLEWSNKIKKASGGKSVGNLRYMHSLKTIGKLIHLEPRDDLKKFWVGAYVSDDAAFADFQQGVLNGFSVGGDYVRTWRDPSNALLKRYIAKPVELSAVDSPCMAGAVVEFIKADGVVETLTMPSQGAKMAEELKKNDQVEGTEAAVDGQAKADVGDEDVAPKTSDGEDGDGAVLPHDKAVEMLQEIRNSAEAEGNFEEADLLTQAITLAVGARDLNGMNGPSDAVEGVAEQENAAEDAGEGGEEDDYLTKVVAANKLAKVGAMLNAQNMAGIHAIIRALAEMAGRAGDEMGKRVAALYQDGGAVSNDGNPQPDASGKAAAPSGEKPAAADAGAKEKGTTPGSAVDSPTDEKTPSKTAPAAGGDGTKDEAAAGDGAKDGEGDGKKPPFMKKADVGDQILHDLAVIASFVDGLGERLAKVEAQPASAGPALRMVPVMNAPLSDDEGALEQALAKAATPNDRAAIQGRLDLIRIKKAQTTAHPLSRS